jgi:hypothetical protein
MYEPVCRIKEWYNQCIVLVSSNAKMKYNFQLGDLCEKVTECVYKFHQSTVEGVLQQHHRLYRLKTMEHVC